MDRLKSLLLHNDPLLQPVKIGQNLFPGIWPEMMPKGLFEFKFPAERRATCMNCPKACYEGFRPDYRCCTYHPRISNFLLGLASETEAGDKAIDRLLNLGMLTPEGMYSTPGQWIDFLEDQSSNRFGKSEAVLCPMLNPENGYCDVHAFRNSVCSTFFCHSDHGQTGETFWVQVQTLGSQIELVLAQWSLRKMGFDVEAYIKAFDALSKDIRSVSTARGWTEEALGLLWGAWRGREKQLMRECAALIVEHRTSLWEIAKSHSILESRLFDEAMDTLVPDHLEGEVEGKDEDLDIDGDQVTLNPEETWEEAVYAHEVLWNLPKGLYQLSPNLSFEANEGLTAEDAYFEGRPYYITYRFKSHEPAQWRLACTAEERAFLEMFKEPISLDEKLLSDDIAKRLVDARTFLSEAVNRRMIWPSKVRR